MSERDRGITVLQDCLKIIIRNLNQVLKHLSLRKNQNKDLKETVSGALLTIDSYKYLKEILTNSAKTETCSYEFEEAKMLLDKSIVAIIEQTDWKSPYAEKIFRTRKELHEAYVIFSGVARIEKESLIRNLAIKFKKVFGDLIVSKSIECTSSEEIMAFATNYSPDKDLKIATKNAIGVHSEDASASVAAEDASASVAAEDASASVASEDASASASIKNASPINVVDHASAGTVVDGFLLQFLA